MKGFLNKACWGFRVAAEACEKGGRWQSAVAVAEEMASAKLPKGLDCRAVDSFCAEAEGTFGLSFMVWGLGFTLTKSGRRRFKVSAFTAEV